MFITNTRDVSWYVIYKDLGGSTKRQLMGAGETVNLTEVTDVSQIVWDSHLRRVRDINDNTDLNRDPIAEGLEARLVLSGGTL